MVIKRRSTTHLMLTLASAIALCILIGGALQLTGLAQRLENRSIDRRFDHRGKLAEPNGVAIVAIDKQTATYINTWPIVRSTYATALSNLKKAGAKVIVLDVPFDDTSVIKSRASMNDAFAKLPDWQRSQITTTPVTFDDTFLESLKENSPIVVQSLPKGGKESGTLQAPLSGLKNEDHKNPLKESKAKWGVSNRIEDSDGVVRRSKTSWADRNANTHRASMGAMALAAATKHSKAPIDPGKSFLLNWYGGLTAFEQISFGDVAFGLTTTRSFQDKVIFIGRTDGVSRDDIQTPYGAQPAVLAQATEYANLRDKMWIRELGWLASAAFIAGIGLLTWLALEFLALPLALFVLGGFIFGLYELSDSLFVQGVAIPFVFPLTVLITTFIAVVMVLVTLSVRERLRIKGLFARYVAPEVVSELLDSNDSIRLGGRQREITVLFSDIRGFTSMSEHIDPEDMVEQLNEYFMEMVQVVTAKRGTLDKFLGDGLMAIFGAPLEQANHAQLACEAALDMHHKLKLLNERRHLEGRPPLAIGIGIHTGKAVVGNVGSPLFRVDFTAIGDTVNLAARLETLTKELDAPIVVSSATANACPTLTFQQKGSVVVKGRTEATEVFELVATATPLPTEVPAPV